MLHGGRGSGRAPVARAWAPGWLALLLPPASSALAVQPAAAVVQTSGKSARRVGNSTIHTERGGPASGVPDTSGQLR